MLLITLLIFLTMLLISFFLLQQERNILTEEVQKRGILMVNMLAEDSKGPLLSDDDLLLHKSMAEVKESEGVVYALISDEKGRIRADSELEHLGKALPDEVGVTILSEEGVIIRLANDRGRMVLDFNRPISYMGIEIGTARLGISTELISKAVMKAQSRILLITLLSLAVGILGSVILSSFLARPIHRLAEGARAIGSGDLDYRIEVATPDELGELTHSFNQMAENLRKKRLIEDAFGRYVTKQVAAEILKHPEQISLEGKRQEVSVLFADIRGFTSLAERIEPEEVVRTLNDYLSLMTKVVFRHDGTLDKFLGDAIMAVFGAPIFFPDHTLRAIRAALDIQGEVRALNEKRGSMGLERVGIGIGINSGEVVTGNIGSEERMEYTVIGHNVNIAARLEDLAMEDQILISQAIYEKVADSVAAIPLDSIQMKGRGRILQVYEVKALVGPLRGPSEESG
jgi:adenylate cyclase